MVLPESFNLGGLAAVGTLGSVLAILLRSSHLNLKTLDTMRRDAAAASDRLRQELRDHDDTIFRLQAMCADYRLAIAKLETENDHLREALQRVPTDSETSKQQGKQRPLAAEKFKTRPEDVLE